MFDALFWKMIFFRTAPPFSIMKNFSKIGLIFLIISIGIVFGALAIREKAFRDQHDTRQNQPFLKTALKNSTYTRRNATLTKVKVQKKENEAPFIVLENQRIIIPAGEDGQNLDVYWLLIDQQTIGLEVYSHDQLLFSLLTNSEFSQE